MESEHHNPVHSGDEPEQKKESKITPELVEEVRRRVVANLEELYTHPSWLADPEHDPKILEKIRSGTKFKGRGGYVEDIVLAEAMKTRKLYDLEDFERLKDEFFE
jgi:hypothetical protein